MNEVYIPTKAHFIRAFGSYTPVFVLIFAHALYEEKTINKSKRFQPIKSCPVPVCNEKRESNL